MKTQKYLNTDLEVIKRIAFDFTYEELLTPTLVYIWNADVDELEKLFDEVLGRLPYFFLQDKGYVQVTRCDPDD